jgi:hypothetical protein
MLNKYRKMSTMYRSPALSSPCSSYDTTSSGSRTTPSSDASSSAASTSPCPDPCYEDIDYDVQNELLVAACAVQQNDNYDETRDTNDKMNSVAVQWEDNQVYMEINRLSQAKIAKALKRRRQTDEAERRKEKKPKAVVEEKEKPKYYDFGADVRSRTRVQELPAWAREEKAFWSAETAVPTPATQPTVLSVKQEPQNEPIPAPPTPDAQSRCEIRPIPGKGFGVVATSNIAQGQAIITESPFLTVDHPPQTQQITSILTRLSQESQDLFHTFTPTLAPCHPNRLVDIVATNVIPLGGDLLEDVDDEIVPIDANGEVEDRCRSGLFKTICRVNHSCAPNARWTWFDSGVMSEYTSFVLWLRLMASPASSTPNRCSRRNHRMLPPRYILGV